MKYIKIFVASLFTMVGVGGSWVNRQDLKETYFGLQSSFPRNTSDVYIEIRLDLKQVVLSLKKAEPE